MLIALLYKDRANNVFCVCVSFGIKKIHIKNTFTTYYI